jgi:CheY-like chemotaxis protein
MEKELKKNQTASVVNSFTQISKMDYSHTTILIVDNSYQIAKIIALSLTSAGYSVLIATSGLEAYKKTLTQKISIVIMDIQMPVLDGIDTTVLIRHRVAVENQPIIIAHTNDITTEERAFRVGMNDIIYKQNSTKELVKKVEEWVILINRI